MPVVVVWCCGFDVAGKRYISLAGAVLMFGDGLDLVVVRFRFSDLDLFALDIQAFATFLNRNGLCWMGIESPVVGDSRDDLCDREGDSPVDVKEDRLDFPRNYFSSLPQQSAGRSSPTTETAFLDL